MLPASGDTRVSRCASSYFNLLEGVGHERRLALQLAHRRPDARVGVRPRTTECAQRGPGPTDHHSGAHSAAATCRTTGRDVLFSVHSITPSAISRADRNTSCTRTERSSCDTTRSRTCTWAHIDRTRQPSASGSMATEARRGLPGRPAGDRLHRAHAAVGLRECRLPATAVVGASRQSGCRDSVRRSVGALSQCGGWE
jgi:hypothetical protein